MLPPPIPSSARNIGNDKGLVTNYGEGGGYKTGGGGHVKFYPYGKGGHKKFKPYWRGDTKSFGVFLRGSLMFEPYWRGARKQFTHFKGGGGAQEV